MENTKNVKKILDTFISLFVMNIRNLIKREDRVFKPFSWLEYAVFCVSALELMVGIEPNNLRL